MNCVKLDFRKYLEIECMNDFFNEEFSWKKQASEGDFRNQMYLAKKHSTEETT